MLKDIESRFHKKLEAPIKTEVIFSKKMLGDVSLSSSLIQDGSVYSLRITTSSGKNKIVTLDDLRRARSSAAIRRHLLTNTIPVTDSYEKIIAVLGPRRK